MKQKGQRRNNTNSIGGNYNSTTYLSGGGNNFKHRRKWNI